MVKLTLSGNQKQIESISEFLGNLRRYRKTDILNIGTALTWDIFKNRKNYELKISQVIDSYAPKLILMALASANDYRNNSLLPTQFFNLCNDFLGIKDPISDKSFMESESAFIVEKLKEKNLIPSKYLVIEIIREICPILFIARSVRQQHEVAPPTLNEFSMMYEVLEDLNNITNGQTFQKFESLFGIKALDFIRASFGIFAIGSDGNRNGKVPFRGLIFEDNIKTAWNIDVKACMLVASKISYNESLLRETWFEAEVLRHPKLYQKYHPTPLYKTPLIHMDKNENTRGVDYLIPSPQIYMTGVRNAIFFELLNKHKDLRTPIGGAIEEHVFRTLKNIFGEKNVLKIPSTTNSRSADFLINLENCNLIIECKTAAGGYGALSVMSPADIADVWSKFYDACEQCAASVKEYHDSKKPIIPIVLIADHITAEAIPFQTFAMRSGIFNDMNVRHIEFISWNYLHSVLSRISLRNFEDQLIERNNKDDATINDILTFNFKSSNSSAHNYEFLKESNSKIFGKVKRIN